MDNLKSFSELVGSENSWVVAELKKNVRHILLPELGVEPYQKICIEGAEEFLQIIPLSVLYCQAICCTTTDREKVDPCCNCDSCKAFLKGISPSECIMGRIPFYIFNGLNFPVKYVRDLVYEQHLARVKETAVAMVFEANQLSPNMKRELFYLMNAAPRWFWVISATRGPEKKLLDYVLVRQAVKFILQRATISEIGDFLFSKWMSLKQKPEFDFIDLKSVAYHSEGLPLKALDILEETVRRLEGQDWEGAVKKALKAISNRS